MEFNHVSVLFNETIESLKIKENGIYVDCTAGGGGHSAGIAEKLTTGHLYALDQDPDAIETLKNRFKDNPNVTVVQNNFSNISAVLKEYGVDGVDGIMADLGVSSHQLDTPERGFSFHHDAPLDMRMSQSGPTAADLINTLDERELSKIISMYGEERYARNIARKIVAERQNNRIETTVEFAELIKSAVPAAARREGGHPARRTFQAIRIAVNQELDKLSTALDDMFDALNPDGVLSIITFHSLEDRIVKQKFATFCEGCTCPKEFPVCVCGKTPRGKLSFKVKSPSEEELEVNPRSRSAKLRAIEKIK